MLNLHKKIGTLYHTPVLVPVPMAQESGVGVLLPPTPSPPLKTSKHKQKKVPHKVPLYFQQSRILKVIMDSLEK